MKYKFIIIILIILIIFYLSNQYLYNNFKEHFNNESNISNMIDYYVINMDKDKERWKYYALWNKNHSEINIQRFPGIYGKDVDRDKLIKNGELSNDNKILDGQLGCALSHIELWKHSLKSDKPYLLVLEDDAILPDDLSKKIEELEEYLPKKWDIVFLGGCNIYGKKYNEKMIIPTRYDKRYNLCLHAVLINKKCIPKLLKIMTPMNIPIDNQIRDNYKILDVYYHNPNLINQNKDLLSERRIIDGLPQSEYWKKNHTNMFIDQ